MLATFIQVSLISAPPLTGYETLGKPHLPALVSSSVKPREDSPLSQGGSEDQIMGPCVPPPSTVPGKDMTLH